VNGRKCVAVMAALGAIMMPVASQAGKRATVPVGLHLAPVAAIAAQTSLKGKRKSKNVAANHNLLGSSLLSGIGMLAQIGALRTSNRTISRGAN